MRNLMLCVLLLLFAASCSIQKRHYRPGFFVQGFQQDKAAARAFPENGKKRDTSVQQHGVATAETGALPVVFAADTIRPADPEMVNPISTDTLLPGKKTKKQLKPLPGETPEETAARKQNQSNANVGAFLLVLSFALTIFLRLIVGSGGFIALQFTVLIFTALGIILLLMASSSNFKLKKNESGRTNGSADDYELHGPQKVRAENQLLFAFVTTISILIQFLLFRSGTLSLFDLLLLAGLGTGVVFTIVSLIILLTIIHRAKKSSGKKRRENKPRGHKTHGKYYVPTVLAITGLLLTILWLFGILILDDYLLVLVSAVLGGVGFIMLIVALVWTIVVVLLKLIR